MPRTKLGALLPDPGAVVKLVERYIKIERRITVEQAIKRTCLTLEDLRSFAKALEIPKEELLAAVADG